MTRPESDAPPPNEVRLMLFLGGAILWNLALIAVFPKLALAGNPAFQLRTRGIAIAAAIFAIGFVLPVFRRGKASHRIGGGMLVLFPVVVAAAILLEIVRSAIR